MKNWLERTPRTMGDWLALAAGTALLLAVAGQLPGLLRAAAGLLALLAPFGWGLVLAYVLDIPTRFFAAKLFGGRRGGALAVSYALLFGVLALLAAFVWACYSILTRKISAWGYPTVLITRRVFLYGILFMLPTLFFFDFRLGLERLTIPTNLVNLLFLGLGASALCFVTWNFAVKILGALKTSVYIYMVPVITVITSVLILHETITPLSGVGIGCTFVGLLLSEYKGKALSQPKQNMQV